MKIEVGARVTPNVRLLRPLGEGGMGAVWVAEHLALGTEVAVKFLQGDYAQDPTARARFSQEAAAASQVKSSHVVKIYDYGITDTNVPFIVMEMLEGTDVAKRIEHERRLPPADVVAIVSQLCKALERAHEHSVIHRDVKPENVFLSNEGGELFVKLLDFGVAKADKGSLLTTGGRRSTLAGESLGTPYYMSPEQFKSSKTSDARSDLWSVGVLAYEALTGALPFVADTVGALAIVVNDASPPLASSIEPSLPPEFDAWFAKACARDPNARFQSARELSDALAVALGRTPLISSGESGPQRRVVISQIDSREIEDLERMSLRDTSFASSGGGLRTTTKNHNRTIAVATVVALVCVIGAFVALRHGPEQAHRETTPTASSPSASFPSPPPPLPPERLTTEPIAIPIPSASVASSVKAAAKATVKPQASAAAPTSSAKETKETKHERDIW